MKNNIVEDFEDALCRGFLKIPKCNKCNKTIWPPVEFCNYCFGVVSLGDDNSKSDITGRIIECSENKTRFEGHTNNKYNQQYNGFFCLVEFEPNIRVMAHISKSSATNTFPKPGARVRLKSCGIDAVDSSYVFDIDMLCDTDIADK